MREGNFKGMWDRLVHSGEAATGVFLFLEISQNSQQNTSARASFLIKLQAEACKTLAQVLLFELWSNIYDGPYYVWLSCRCRRATLLKWTPSQTFFAAESNSWSFRWCLLLCGSIQRIRASYECSKKLNTLYITIFGFPEAATIGVLLKKGFFKNSAKCTGKHLCQSLHY